MADDKAQKLLSGGIRAARNGQAELARKAFRQVLKLEPDNESAWIGLATVTEERDAKIRILNKVLALNPQNTSAQEALDRLGADAPTDDDPDLNDGAVFSASAPLEDDAPIPEPTLADLGLGDDLDDLPPIEIKPPAAELEDGSATTSDLEQMGDAANATLKFDDDDAPTAADDSSAASEDDRDIIEQAFANAPPPPPGYDGTPIVNPNKLRIITPQVEAELNALLQQSIDAYQGIEWTRKTRARAGAQEYTRFLATTGITVLVFFIVLVGGGGYLLLQNEDVQRIVFAPTWTPSVTPTPTLTATPGATNTPSPTPRLTATPSPTVRPTITPASTDPIFPIPTEDTYYSPGIEVDLVIDEAELLLDQGALQEAFDILQAERLTTGGTGDFIPYYYLTRLFIRQNQVDEAITAVDEYFEEWGGGEDSPPTRQFNENITLIRLAQARIALAQARRADLADDANARDDFLDEAEAYLSEMIEELDPAHPESYILLADIETLRGDPEAAIDVLTDAIDSDSQPRLYTDLDLRFKRIELYREQAQYDAALQDLYQLVLLNPFIEEALAQQAEVALEADRPGLGVLFSQQYLFYYPGSVRGHALLGQSRLAEGKYDLALNVLTRGLEGGDARDPFYPNLLVQRARAYLQLDQIEAAEDDLTRAISLGEDNPQVLALQVETARITGNYDAVISNAEELLNTGIIANGDLYTLIGQAQVEQGNYSEGLDALNQALNVAGTSDALLPVANEYLARAHLNLNDLDPALAAINIALTAEDTVGRRYIRGQIHEREGDLDLAVADYEFVLTWGRFYSVAFLESAQERYDRIRPRVRR